MPRVVKACLLAAVLVGLAVIPATSVGAQLRPAASKGATVTLKKSSSAGTILVASGQVLFYFTRDHGAKSSCFSTCAVTWPPFDSSHPVAGAGVEQKLLSTIRRGSSRQVTYDGHPLYLYNTTGGFLQQTFYIGVNNFGGIWEGVRANGAGVR